MQEINKAVQKVYQGIVVSDKMDKTIVVAHKRTYRNLHTDKIMKKVKKYKVHDEHGQASVGNMVEFYEGKPISKTKYMYLARVVEQ
ncbi:MAG: 30S ribosomal protein S17 [Candidatus Babeliales bacterium]